jgi:hypothetical protein
MTIARRIDTLERQAGEADLAPPLPVGANYVLDMLLEGFQQAGVELGAAARSAVAMVRSPRRSVRDYGLSVLTLILERSCGDLTHEEFVAQATALGRSAP